MRTWPAAVVTSIGEVVAVSVTVASILSLFYVGLAVGVALFHPDHRRRRDARAVLGCLADFLPRSRRRPTSPAPKIGNVAVPSSRPERSRKRRHQQRTLGSGRR